MRYLSVLFFLVLVGGCATLSTPEQYRSKVRFNNDQVYVTQISEAALPDGTLKVAVYGASTVKWPQRLRYKAHWYDRNNIPINTSVDNWEQMNLDPKSPFEFAVVGPGPRGARYLIEFETN